MESFPQIAQAGRVSDDHEDRSQEVVIVSDDDSEDPRSPKEGGGDGRQSRQSVPRLRWTLWEDCKLAEVVASRRQKILWRIIADGFPHRSSNSCRLRWLKLLTTEDASTENRWSEMAMFMGDGVIDQWRVMIAQNLPDFYAIVPANHPLKRSSVQNVGPVITDPAVGGDDNGVGDTSMVSPAIDLSLSLATGLNQNY